LEFSIAAEPGVCFMTEQLAAVITTIQEPTGCVRQLASALRRADGLVVIIGDAKGPAKFEVEGAVLISLEEQLRLPLALSRLLPTGHYARKNLGYLIAAGRGATCIYETDDDNAPGDGWHPRSLCVDAQSVEARSWLNVYRLFCDDLIWPRGFPLNLVRDQATWRHDPAAPQLAVESPVQQGLVNGSPDVDAVWRLILDREFTFARRPSVWLPPHTWCPFNSQSTWWWPQAYPLMYLPSYCSFRMTDIWRSFVAQRCLWEMGFGLVFHAAEVLQDRNVHNLTHDFHDEIPGYEGNERLVQTLERTRLETGADAAGDNLARCYRALVAEQFLPRDEITLVDAWLRDVKSLEAIENKAGVVVPK
jgi:hypothetical protein